MIGTVYSAHWVLMLLGDSGNPPQENRTPNQDLTRNHVKVTNQVIV